MKTIRIQITGTDGEPHGHGGWEMDPEDFDVTESQYEKIKEAYYKGENDLEMLAIHGLKQRCRDIVKEYRGYARDRGAHMQDVEVYINVVGLEEEDEE